MGLFDELKKALLGGGEEQRPSNVVRRRQEAEPKAPPVIGGEEQPISKAEPEEIPPVLGASSEQPPRTKPQSAKPKAKKKKKQYQAPGPEQTIVIEYLNYAGELKQFIGDPKSIVRKGNHFSVRVAPTFKRISLNRSKTRILKGVPAPAALPAEPLPVQTTTSDTSVIQYTNFEGIDKEFTIITGVIDDKGDYVRVRVSPTFKYITLKRTRIGNPEALFESTSPAAAPAGETAQVTPEPVETGEPVSQATTGTVNMVITSCGLATYDATAILRDLRAGSDAFDLHGLLKDFPKTVAENVSVEKANEFKKRFEDAGCTVELHPWTGTNEQPETTEATEPQTEAAIEEPEPIAEVTKPDQAPEQESTPEPEQEPEPASATTSAKMDVVITGCGMSTYNANKVLQELKPGVGYFDISKLLRDFPQVAFENLSPEEAEANKAKLEATDCTVELRPHGKSD